MPPLFSSSLPGVPSLPAFVFAVSAASVRKVLALAHHKGVSLYYFRFSSDLCLLTKFFLNYPIKCPTRFPAPRLPRFLSLDT